MLKVIINTLRAEWTKLRTTKSFYWTTGLIFLLSFLWALFNGLNAEMDPAMPISPLTAEGMNSILLMLGIPIIMIQAIMIVTTEYRFGLQSTVFMANPNSSIVALVKLLMYAVIAAVILFLALVLIYFVSDLSASKEIADIYKPFEEDGSKRALWLLPLLGFMVVIFVQGLGWLLRQTAGTVALSLILYLGIENVVRLLPKVGDDLIPYMPFSAFGNWASDTVPENVPWDSSAGSAIVFIVWAVALWILGVFVLEKRDA